MKTTDTSDLVKNGDYDTKLDEIEREILNYNNDK